MATKVNETTAIVVPETTEIRKLEKFTAVITQLEKRTADIIVLEEKARALVIDTPERFQEAKALMSAMRESVKEAKALVDPYSTPLRKWTDFTRMQLNIPVNRGEQMKGILERKMADYTEAENRKAADEKARLEAAAKSQNVREAVDKRMLDLEGAVTIRDLELKDAKAQYNAGQLKSRAYDKVVRDIQTRFNEAKARIDIEYQQRAELKVDIDVEPLAGGGTAHYHAECKDPEAFLMEFAKRFIAGDRSLRKFVTVSDQALNAEAKEVKSDEKMEKLYPHVHAWTDRTF